MKERPVWNVLEAAGFKLTLANPQHIKEVAGRKTDQKNAEWIAKLGRMELVSPSYVPPTEIQELRYLTRTRSNLISEKTQHKNRVHNVLQQANIKLMSFLSDIFGKTGRKLFDLLLSGEKLIEELVQSCLHSHIHVSAQDILGALEGTFSCAHLIELEVHFNMIAFLESQTTELNKEIHTRIALYQEISNQLMRIPGINQMTVEVISAEIGPSVAVFKIEKHLAS